MRLFLAVAMILALGLCSGCLGGRAHATNDAARADLLLGRSF